MNKKPIKAFTTFVAGFSFLTASLAYSQNAPEITAKDHVIIAPKAKPQLESSNGTKTLAILRAKPGTQNVVIKNDAAANTPIIATPVNQTIETTPVIKEKAIGTPNCPPCKVYQNPEDEQMFTGRKQRDAKERVEELTKSNNSKKSNDSEIKFYAGVNGNLSHASHQYHWIPDQNWHYNGNNTHKDALGFGFELGARQNFGKVFVGVDTFYDQLNNKAKSPPLNGTVDDLKVKADNTKISNRFGAKINIGYAISKKLEPFLMVGITGIRYSHQTYGYASSYNSPYPARTKLFVPLFGGGLNYNINDNLSLKVSYDYQVFDTRYMEEGERIRTKLGVLKTGIDYNF